MTRKRNLAVSFLVGLTFSLGLGLSGMTQPQKVIGFLDLFGAWDPSLAFVMLGAVGVHAIAYRLMRHRTSPFFSEAFSIPHRRDIDKRLLIGSGLFGIGWGLGGYCPGPGVTALVSLSYEPLVFVLFMVLGMYLFRFQRSFQKKASS